MPIRRLTYVTHARMPTEKAHGFQIAKMCEAFAGHGVRTTLLYPRRHQVDARLAESGVAAYYGLPASFRAVALANRDVVPLSERLPHRAFVPLFFGHALVWSLYAVTVGVRAGAELFYTRSAEAAFWLTRLGRPVVYEAHGVPKGAQRALLRAVAGGGSLRLTVALTSYIRDGLAGLGFAPERTLVEPDAVDLAAFGGSASRQECRRALGLPAERPVVGYVGRFNTQGMEKGLAELVGAVASLTAAGGAAPLLLCVGGPMDDVPRYRAIGRAGGLSDDDMLFHDRVPNVEVPRWIGACDVVTIPWGWSEFSAYFTSPLKLFEYMAAGVPIVASDLPSLREVLRPDENAALTRPGDAEALARGIGRLLGDPVTAARLAGAARRDVEAYTWKARAARILARAQEA